MFDKVNVGGDDSENGFSAVNTLGISTEDEDDEHISIKMRARRYNILSVPDLKKALGNMSKDIELQVENSPLRHSGLRINKAKKKHPLRQVQSKQSRKMYGATRMDFN